MNNEKLLDITWGTIFKIFIAAVTFYFIYILRDFLVWFLFALIIAVLLDPPIEFLKKLKIPRVVGAIFIYFAIFGAIGFLIYLIAPVFIIEIQQVSRDIPNYFEKVHPILGKVGIQTFANLESFLDSLKNFLEKSSLSIFNALFSIFGGIFTGFFIITIAIFLSFESRVGERALVLFFPKKDEQYLVVLWAGIKKKISRWFMSRIVASIFVGIASYFILFVFGINYPVSLAIFAGVLNFVPIVGPVFTAIVFFIIVFPQSLMFALYIIALFTAIQQIEGSILTPVLTRKFIGLPPVLVLLALAVGGKLWGIMGALLSIPLAGIIFEFLKDYLKKRREEKAVTL